MNPQKLILTFISFIAISTCCVDYKFADDTKPADNSKASQKSSFLIDPNQSEIPSNAQISASMPEPWGSQVEEIVKKYPWYGGIDQPTYMPEGVNISSVLKSVLADIPPEKLIPFLEHPVKYVRDYAKSELKTYADPNLINDTFANGSPRVRFELFPLLNQDSFRTWSDPIKQLDLLNEILKGPSAKIYGSDLSMYNMYQGKLKDPKTFDLLNAYLRLLKSDFLFDRTDAMRNLMAFKDNAYVIIPRIIEFIEKPDVLPPKIPGGRTALSQKAIACNVVASFKENAKDAIPALKNALNDHDLNIRICASAALYQIGYEPEAQLEYLSEQISKTKSTESLSLLLDSISGMGKIPEGLVPVLTELTRHDDQTIRSKAMNVLRSAVDYKEITNIYIKNLDSPNPDVRLDAISHIGGRTSSSNKAEYGQYLIRALDDPDINVKALACRYLIESGSATSFILPHIIEILESDQTSALNSSELIKRMKKLGPSAKNAVPSIIKSLGKTDSYQSRELIGTILELGGTYDQIVKHLVELVKSNDTHAAEIAIYYLGEIGGRAIEAVPAIGDYLANLKEEPSNQKRDTKLHPYSKGTLENAQQKILNSIKPGQKVPVPILHGMLKSTSKEQIKNAINMLIWSGESWENIFFHLKMAIASENREIQRAALYATGDLGNQAVSLVPFLLNLAEIAKNNKKEYSHFYDTINKIVSDLQPSDWQSVDNLLPLVGVYYNSELSRKAIKQIIALTGNYDLVADKLIERINKITNYGSNDYHSLLSDLTEIGFKSKKVYPALKELAKKDEIQSQFIFYRLIDSITGNVKDQIDNETLLDLMAYVSGTNNLEKIRDIYIEKGGTYDKLAIRLAEILSYNNSYSHFTVESFLRQLKEKAEAALPKLREIYKDPKTDTKLKTRLNRLIEEIEMAVEKAKK